MIPATQNSGSQQVSNNQTLKDEELRDKLQELFFKRIKEEDMIRIMEEHKCMSQGLGILIGIAGRGAPVQVKSLVDEHERILEACMTESFSEFQKSQNKDIILSFLRSKDDNLLLLVGGLIMSIQYNRDISPELLGQVPEICPFKFRKSSNQEEAEEEKKQETS